MNDSGSKPVKRGWRRLLPLIARATVSRWISGSAGWLADWITPELAEEKPTPTSTSVMGGADERPV